MKRFVEGEDRRQITLLPDCVDGYIGEDNPVRAVEAFVGELDLAGLGFAGVVPEASLPAEITIDTLQVQLCEWRKAPLTLILPLTTTWS